MTQTAAPTRHPALHIPHARPVVAGGALVAVGGLAAISFPLWAGEAATSLVAWTLVMVGALRMLTAFNRAGGHRWKLLGGLTTLAVGAVVLRLPQVGADGITLLIAGVLLADGLFAAIEAVRRSRRRLVGRQVFWRLALIDGLLAIVMMAAWPFRAEVALGLLVGASLVLSGFALITIGLTGDPPAPETHGFRRKGDDRV
ncbi:MAG TPA: DUF308 domain-containing protein [Phenylobacterium sp.]|jgi:uncharacterized membrane protein HdeD (DUF308 family)|uniref:HdeD family acid-resistance protein n=1 Tax=Phenylobacterium sp. TaxID=1871053 RepID=UPI002C226DFE|nr:DUF308 domain-containing protein [Phenylobacterium sp.]HXA40967.1 DUF308 domain-containing protein [Phenylobacterium sp.]